ncbi:MAG TPA: hypothetical protein VNO43_13620 [Candidatus Eisenbacteria bacterium]|nr:hypothetical protein [Candidatus Eisenbacteria bacterium]
MKRKAAVFALFVFVAQLFGSCVPQPLRAPVWESSDVVYLELNGIEREKHREIRAIEGAKRHTAPLAELQSKYDLTPRPDDCVVIYFGQASVQPEFSRSGFFKGALLEDVVERIRKGEIDPKNIPVEFIWVDGKRVAVNNRSLTVLYKAGIRPTNLVDRTGNLPDKGPDTLESVLRRLEGMGGKPSTEIGIRTNGTGRDGLPKRAEEWDAPIGEYVSMPEELMNFARACRYTQKKAA